MSGDSRKRARNREKLVQLGIRIRAQEAVVRRLKAGDGGSPDDWHAAVRQMNKLKAERQKILNEMR